MRRGRAVLGEIENIFETQRTQSAQRTAMKKCSAVWFPLRSSAPSAFQSVSMIAPRKTILDHRLLAPQPKEIHLARRAVDRQREGPIECLLRDDASESHME